MNETRFSIATVNAQEDKFLRSSRLDSFPDVDYLLMQEVNQAKVPDFAERLHGQLGLTVLAESSAMQLIIAGSQRVSVDSVLEHEFSSLGLVEGFMFNRLSEGNRYQRHFKKRGLLMARTLLGGCSIDVTTTHLMVPVRPLMRRKQLREIPEALSNMSLATTSVLGGDMNSWPAPGADDLFMQKSLAMNRVDIGAQKTWLSSSAEGTRRQVGKFVPIDAQMDAILWRGRDCVEVSEATRTIDIDSDHKAIISYFDIKK